MKKKITANFFWSGGEISIYEYCCIKSFINNKFNVNVYSFESLKLPNGANLKDASTILKKNQINKFIHNGKIGCLAAFADKFRIALLKKNKDNWWFDADVLCLRNATYFQELEKNNPNIIGLENKNEVNNAILKISDSQLLNIIYNQIIKRGYILKWGDIGPKLLTSILKKNNNFNKSFPQSYFYPINYNNFKYLILPKFLNEAEDLCKKSYTTHNYNQIFTRFCIPKNILPPKGSFLNKYFLSNCPELKKVESLPERTAERLLDKQNGFKENLFDLIPSFLRSFR